MINLASLLGKRKRKSASSGSRYTKRKLTKNMGVRSKWNRQNPVTNRIVSNLKYSQVAGEFSTLNDGWTIFTLNDNVDTGPLQKQNRIGDKVVFKKIHLRMSIQSDKPDGTETWPTSESNTEVGMRFVVVEDRQANGIIPSAAEVFEAVFDPINRYNNLANKDRFNILADRFEMFNQGHKAGGVVEMIMKPNVVTQYEETATSGAMAFIKTGAIHLFVTTHRYYVGGPADGFTVDVAGRLRYTDL